jgi:bifunctional polynucleotide phosphatase/kinase
MPGLPGAGVFCRDGPPSLLHFYNGDVLADDDAPSPSPSSTPSPSGRRKVALSLYDLDGTLIRPKSGYKFPRGADDWMWWHRDVPKRLRADVAAGRHVIVLSNQNVHGRMLRDWKEKIRMIAHEVGREPKPRS